MGDQDANAPRSGPVRIVSMSITPHRRTGDPLTIVAQLDPAPDQAEMQWWIEQLRERVKVEAWSGSGAPGPLTGPPRMTRVHVEAPDDELEPVARRLIAAVEEANAAYPDRYRTWRRARDAQVAEEQRRQQQRLAEQQAVLDRVMDEYRSD
jgi:hypothetical protein